MAPLGDARGAPGAGARAFGDLDEAAGGTDDRARARQGVSGIRLRTRRARPEGRLLRRHGRSPRSAGGGSMRFGEVFRYEFSHRLRSVSTWLYAGVLFLLAFWIIHVAVTGTNPVHVNAPKGLAETTALFCGLCSILVT